MISAPKSPGATVRLPRFVQKTMALHLICFQKISVKGSGKASLYKTLTESANPSGDVGWNFEKFLIDRNGAVVGRFKSGVSPQDPVLIQAVESAL